MMRAADPRQLAEWFDDHAAALVLYARQWLGREAAEDVVQDVFIKLLSGSAPTPRQTRAWLFRAVRNASISHARAWTRRLRRERIVAANQPPLFESRQDDAIDARAAETALAQLPAAQREALVLRIWSGLTLAEIAEVTSTSTSTAHEHYRAGILSLRQILESSCGKITKTSST